MTKLDSTILILLFSIPQMEEMIKISPLTELSQKHSLRHSTCFQPGQQNLWREKAYSVNQNYSTNCDQCQNSSHRYFDGLLNATNH